jgi:hypothetical protein
VVLVLGESALEVIECRELILLAVRLQAHLANKAWEMPLESLHSLSGIKLVAMPGEQRVRLVSQLLVRSLMI